MMRVGDVLSEMATAVGEAAERAMSTAVAVESMHRQARLVSTLVKEAVSKAEAAAEDGSSSSSESESDDEDEAAKKAKEEAKRKAAEEEAKRKEEEAAAEAARGDPEANLTPLQRQRLANARLLRKLSVEVREAQGKMRELVLAAPQLLPGVTVTQKEDLFQQLAEVLAAAEQPIARRWYEQRRGGGSSGGGGGADDAADAEWVAL